jgi:hypothetical protein
MREATKYLNSLGLTWRSIVSLFGGEELEMRRLGISQRE